LTTLKPKRHKKKKKKEIKKEKEEGKKANTRSLRDIIFLIAHN